MTDWRELARCAETDPEIWYPENGQHAITALRICATCEVQAECLAWALEANERHGVFGGIPEGRRRKMHAEYERSRS